MRDKSSHYSKGAIVGVTVCLPLFGPPGREMEEGKPLIGQQLRNLATELHDRLHTAADTLDRLAAAGWSARVAMYDAILTRAGVATKEDAERRLGELGLSSEDFIIIEDVEEEEESGHA
jgi:hypothetical protein